MDRAPLPYLVSGNHRFGRVNLERATAAAALTANELLREGYMDVRICTPRGVVLLSDEFGQHDPGESAIHS